VQSAIFPHLPPPDFEAPTLQIQPRGYIRLVIKIAYDDFPAIADVLGDGQAYYPDERRCIHPECYFGRLSGIQERCHTVSRALDSFVYFSALPVASSALNISRDQVMLHGVEHHLRNLCSRAIIKEDEIFCTIEGWKRFTNPRDGKFRTIHGHCCCNS
jgi:hypothetical protein